MKGISNILPSFTRTVLCVLCALGLSLGAYAQSRTATVNVKDVTVKELLKAIEAGSSYTFAYVDTDIDLAGKVSVTAKNEDAVLDVSIIGYNSASVPDRIINVDIDMYKVRVRKW